MKSPYKAVMLAVVVLVVIVVGYYAAVDKGPAHNIAPGGGPIDRTASTSGGRSLRDVDRLGAVTPPPASDATATTLGPIASATTGGAATPGMTSSTGGGIGSSSTTLGVTPGGRSGELPMSGTGPVSTTPTGAATRPSSLGGSTPITPYAGGTTGGSSMPVTFDNTPATRPSDPLHYSPPTSSVEIARSAVPPEPAAAKEYTIKAGDTFASIAARTLGSADKWHEIAQANPRVDPTKLKVGMTIRLPGKAAATTAGGTTTDRRSADNGSTTSTPTGGASHTIRAGETLTTISQKYYGTGSQWKRIYNANKAKIGSDPDHLPVGATIAIPPKN